MQVSEHVVFVISATDEAIIYNLRTKARDTFPITDRLGRLRRDALIQLPTATKVAPHHRLYTFFVAPDGARPEDSAYVEILKQRMNFRELLDATDGITWAEIGYGDELSVDYADELPADLVRSNSKANGPRLVGLAEHALGDMMTTPRPSKRRAAR